MCPAQLRAPSRRPANGSDASSEIPAPYPDLLSRTGEDIVACCNVQTKTASRKRDAAQTQTAFLGLEKASQKDAKPSALIGASPFQEWEASPFPATPYRPRTVGGLWPFDVARGRPLGNEARRCCDSVVQRTVKSVALFAWDVKTHGGRFGWSPHPALRHRYLVAERDALPLGRASGAVRTRREREELIGRCGTVCPPIRHLIFSQHGSGATR